MKHSFLDKYASGSSLVHRLDPRTKLLGALAFITLVVVTPNGKWLAFGVYFLIAWFLVIMSRVPPGYVLRRSLVILPFVGVLAVFAPFFIQGQVLAGVKIGPWNISITREGLLLFSSVLIKSWISVTNLILLTSTTSFSRLLKGMERLHMPYLLVMLLSFMYRYIFILTDEVMRMKQARDSRNFSGSRGWQLKTIGNMIGTLFIRSYERGERVYASMMSRGFDGQSRSLDSLAFTRLDALFGTSLALGLVCAGILILL